MSGYLRWNMRGKKPSIFPSQCNLCVPWLGFCILFHEKLRSTFKFRDTFLTDVEKGKKKKLQGSLLKKRFRTKQGRHSFCHQYKVFILIRWNQYFYRQGLLKSDISRPSLDDWSLKGKRLLWIFWLNGERWSILEQN